MLTTLATKGPFESARCASTLNGIFWALMMASTVYEQESGRTQDNHCCSKNNDCEYHIVDTNIIQKHNRQKTHIQWLPTETMIVIFHCVISESFRISEWMHFEWRMVARHNDPTFPVTARSLLEYGADKEGYWNSEKFMANVEDAAKIANFKYPADKCKVLFIFDQSNCHHVFAEDALNAKVMNVKLGGGELSPACDTE